MLSSVNDRTAWSIYTHKTDFDPARLTKALT
jgi:hypothetical protein